MWDGLFMLLALSTIMGTASFLAGILPLSLSLSQKQLRFISLLGTGVLVGTSLIVIIPEGIETMYSAGKKGGSHVDTQSKPSISSQRQSGSSRSSGFVGLERSEAFKAPFLRREAGEPSFVDIIVERTPLLPRASKEKDKTKEKEKEAETEENHPLAQKGGDDDSTEGHKEGHTRVHAPEGEQENDTHEPGEEQEHHAYIGVALILGFILMFLVDHLPEAIAPTKQQYHPLHISLSDLSRGPHNSSTASLTALNTPVSPMPERMPAPPPKSSATTVGLIIHAFADGIALGASSTAPSTSLSFIIFLAIMLHKAPAAFGLTSVLLRKGLSKRTARTHLILFSLAAPAGAVFTWSLVHILGRTTLGGDDGLTWTTGWVLLFSGGTFLYVAMHAMTEATSAQEELVVNGYMDSHHAARSTLSKSDIAVTLVGMLVPLLTQIGHVH
ncbi:Zinc/iron permease [Westerdykella ornata]|uniref:Zinc/iron permease n=1 Tax=Westerdykella ornata TaxID=318751 RepID=A0A6A6JNC2_WESOR|nr:Zinc/iron permease [Westerdykella ornata]KAF2277744.1 Zinc/iron permease [Westerdykella ornata]